MPSKKDQEAIELRSREPMAFFSHDSNASTDIKCRRLIRRCGMEGYGRWWCLCELLAATDGHAVPVATDEDMLIVADALRFTSGGAFNELKDIEDCKAFVDVLIELGLVTLTDEGEITSKRMMRNAQFFGRNRVNGAKGGRPRKDRSKRSGEDSETD